MRCIKFERGAVVNCETIGARPPAYLPDTSEMATSGLPPVVRRTAPKNQALRQRHVRGGDFRRLPSLSVLV